MKVWLLATVLVVAAAAVLFFANVVHARYQRSRMRRDILRACESNNKETTFVMFVCVKNAFGGARTLRNLFQQAACPLRVFVGVYEVYDPASLHSVAGIYEQMLQRDNFPFQLVHDHVRVIRVPAAEYRGVFAARQQILHFLYRNETYIMSTICPAVFRARWDSAAAEMLAAQPRVTILTTKPGRVCAANTLPSTAPATFVATTDAFDDGRAPKMRSYAMKTTDVAVPATAWSADFSFCCNKDVQFSSLFPSLFFWDSYQDWVITFRLLAAHVHITHPHVAFSVATGCAYDAVTDEPSTAVLQTWLTKMSQNTALWQRIHKMHGISPGSSNISARGRLGLTPNADAREINAKVGSATEYASLLARVNLAER